MAEYEERNLEDLTEEPSPARLEELREKGTVAHSKELAGTAALIGIMLALYFTMQRFTGSLTGLMKDIYIQDMSHRMAIHGYASFTAVAWRCMKVFALGLLPMGAAAMALGIAGSLAQIGFLFSGELINPDFKRVNPVSGFMRLFSMKNLLEGIKSTLKVVLVGLVVYSAIKSRLVQLPDIVSYGIYQLFAYIGQTTVRIFGVVVLFLILMAGFDYWIQWREFRKQAMMTKQEARKELKEREGDPQIKARIRSIQRDMARKRMMKAIPEADVIITNPTHIAVAIAYNPEEGFAPKVLAKGADFLAQRIKKIAREHEIPTVENKPLARTLYKHVKVGQMIPRSLYRAVAEILAYVYKLKGKKLF